VSDNQIPLSDIDKSALLMISIGEDAAAEVLKHLSPNEINVLSAAMARMLNVPKNAATAVFSEFIDILSQENSIGTGGHSYVQGVLDKALGADEAKRFVGRLQQGDSGAGIDALQSQNPRTLAEMIKGEHPQVVATIFAYLEPEKVDAVIQHLPPELIDEVIPRLATLDQISPAAIRELSEVIEDLMAGDADQERVSLGGVSMSAKILNRMDQPRITEILQKISDVDADLSKEIENSMFVFEDLANVDDRNFQILLRSVDQKLLSAALKAAGQDLQDKVFRNLSQRTAEALRDEIAARGPMLLSEVNAAKQEIVATAQRLEREGAIVLSTDPGQMVA
jgi:flagellar motor switch protein FliG